MAKRKMSQTIYNEAYKDKDKGGSSRQSYMDWSKFKDNDIKFYNTEEKTAKFNIIPYEIKSKNHPLVRSGRAEIEELDFMLDVWVHRYTGPDNADILCPKKNYGKACPVCDLSSELYEKGKKEEAKKMAAKRRVILNVQPIVQGEAQPLQIFEESYFTFMKELLEEANDCSNGDDLIPFAHPEKGKVIKFRASLEKWGNNDYMKYKSFAFLDREEEIDDKLIDQAVSFDEGLILLPPEEIEKIMYGQDEDEDEKKPEKTDDEKPAEDKPETKPEEKKESEPEKEKPKEEEKPEKGKCPHEYKWGMASDDTEGKEEKECNRCSLWEDCVEVKK